MSLHDCEQSARMTEISRKEGFRGLFRTHLGEDHGRIADIPQAHEPNGCRQTLADPDPE